MEEPKPKVPPRSSLLKKGVIENGAATPPPVTARPMLPSKPKILSPKPETNSASTTTASAKASIQASSTKVERTANSEPTLVAPLATSLKTSNVKVCNKLKISASDLNKLR